MATRLNVLANVFGSPFSGKSSLTALLVRDATPYFDLEELMEHEGIVNRLKAAWRADHPQHHLFEDAWNRAWAYMHRHATRDHVLVSHDPYPEHAQVLIMLQPPPDVIADRILEWHQATGDVSRAQAYCSWVDGLRLTVTPNFIVPTSEHARIVLSRLRYTDPPLN